MDLADYKGNTTTISQRSCLKNSEKKLNLLKEYMMQKSVNFIEKQVNMIYDQKCLPLRGLLVLPLNFNDLVNPNKNYLLQDVNLHMCCLTRLNDDKILYAHLLNSKGIPIQKGMLKMDDLIFILITSYLVYNSKVFIFLI